MTTHSSILAWKFPWTPGGLKSTMTTVLLQPMIMEAVCAREGEEQHKAPFLGFTLKPP